MAFDWSYDLLTDLRQLILRRLSVFRRRLRPFVGDIIDNSWNRHYIGGSISWDPEIAADGFGRYLATQIRFATLLITICADLRALTRPDLLRRVAHPQPEFSG
jgi:hypothetical protein